MSGLELAVLGAVGAGYLDARWQLTKDLSIIKRSFSAAVNLLLNVRRNHINAFLILESWVQSQPNKTFLVYPEPVAGAKAVFVDGMLSNADSLFKVKKWTYKQTYDKILKYARVLHEEYGVRGGEAVAMDFVNKDEFIFVWFALWSLGACPAFINYNLQTKALVHCVKAANCKLFLVDDEVKENGLEVADELSSLGVPTVIVDDAFKSKADKQTPFRQTDELRGFPEMHDAACYIYTSGTTGLPKAGIMSWRKIQASQVYGAAIETTSNDRIYSAMPLYHSTAAVLGFMPAVHYGASYAIGHKFSTTTFWTQAKLSNATAVQYVGETCRYLFNAPPGPDERSHSVVKAMGNGLRPDIWAKFKERFNIKVVAEFYGATELPTALTNQQYGDFGVGACASYGSLVGNFLRRKVFNIFRVDPDTQDVWRDPQTGLCKAVDYDEPGEMLFEVDANDIKSQFQGYVGNKDATDEKIIRSVKKKNDAWVRSGDLLKINRDNMVYFVDRMGDTFRWKSENVSTNEVEEAFTEVEGIKQVVCVGVKVPNHEGRAGFAVVELKESEKIPDLQLLGRHAISRLPKYAVPVFVKFVNEIATTGNNKTQKKSFRDQKLPSADEDIYWLMGDKYVKLTGEHWNGVESGDTKL